MLSFILIILIGISGIVITLYLTQVEDKNYNYNKSFSNMIVMYAIFLPVLLVSFGYLRFNPFPYKFV